MQKCELYTLDSSDIKFTGNTIITLMSKVNEGNKDQTKPLKSKYYWQLRGMLGCLCTFGVHYEILWNNTRIMMEGIIIEDIEFKVEEEE